MPRKKAFTLIELMIVMVIIGILILIGMGLNRSQLKSLKASTAVEAFQARFDTLFLQIITSNHHRSSPYHQLKIQLTTASEEQDSAMNYYFEKLDWSEPWVRPSFLSSFAQTTEQYTEKKSDFSPLLPYHHIPLTALSSTSDLSMQPPNAPVTLEISYTPFETTCQLTLEGQELSQALVQIQPKGGNPACFQLKKSYCRLQNISCPQIQD